LILAFALLKKNELDPTLFVALLISTVIVLLQRVNNMTITAHRAFKLFHIESRQMIWSALLNFILIVLLAYRFEVYGFMVAVALGMLFNIVYLWAQKKIRFQLANPFQNIAYAIKIGFPILILTLLNACFLSIDKIMIAGFLGLEALGLYSIAILAFNSLQSLPNAFGIVLFPNFQEIHAKNESNTKVLMGQLWESVRNYVWVMPFFMGAAWIISPYFVSWVLPDFKDGIASMKILILCVYFAGVSIPFRHYLITLKKDLIVIAISAVAILIAVILDYYLIHIGQGIQGVALATTLVFFIHFLMLFALCHTQGFGFAEIIGKLGYIAFFFATSCLVIYAVDKLLRIYHPVSGLELLLKLVVFIFVYLAPMIHFLKRIKH